MARSIITDNRRILDYGSFMLYSQESTAIIIVEIEQGITFNLEIKFEKQDDGKSEIKKVFDGDNECIRLVCVNFNNSLGTGTTYPLELAIYKGKRISIHLWSMIMGEIDEGATRKIEYTIYIDKEQSV